MAEKAKGKKRANECNEKEKKNESPLHSMVRHAYSPYNGSSLSGKCSIPVWAVIFTFPTNPYIDKYKSFHAFFIQLRNQNVMSCTVDKSLVSKSYCAGVRALWQRTNTHLSGATPRI